MTDYVKVPADWVRDLTQMMKEWKARSRSVSNSRLWTISGLVLPVELTEDWKSAEGGKIYAAKARRVRFDKSDKTYLIDETRDEITIYDPASGEEKPSSQVGDRVGVVYRGRWEVVGVPSSVSIHVGTVRSGYPINYGVDPNNAGHGGQVVEEGKSEYLRAFAGMLRSGESISAGKRVEWIHIGGVNRIINAECE